jgi:hypothetical protein
LVIWSSVGDLALGGLDASLLGRELAALVGRHVSYVMAFSIAFIGVSLFDLCAMFRKRSMNPHAYSIACSRD